MIRDDLPILDKILGREGEFFEKYLRFLHIGFLWKMAYSSMNKTSDSQSALHYPLQIDLLSVTTFQISVLNSRVFN